MNVMELFSLKGKVALVTGGAGVLGQQIVTALVQAGARTYTASRNLVALEEVASRFRREGYEVIAKELDLGDESSILRLKDELLEREGKIDILVNNAAVKKMSGWNDDARAFDESMKVNATGLFLITRAFGNEMAKRKTGAIINIASTYGMSGPDRGLYEGTDISGYLPDYNYVKAGMIGFTRFVASYYGPDNVRCNCISPVGIRTGHTPEKFAENYGKRIFLGRMGQPSDLAGAVVFLASEASAFVTGVNIPVDGGFSSR